LFTRMKASRACLRDEAPPVPACIRMNQNGIRLVGGYFGHKVSRRTYKSYRGIRLRHQGDPHHHPPSQEGRERAAGGRIDPADLHGRTRHGMIRAGFSLVI
jgi:hypothetical protein